MQTALEPTVQTVDPGNGATLQLVRIPAGTFVMGDAQGQPDEQPLSVVTIERPFWMGTTEISNAVYRQFDAGHDCRYYNKRHAQPDDKGLPLNAANQPVVRSFLARGHGLLRLALPPDRHAFYTPDRVAMGVGRSGRFGKFALWYGGLDTDPAPYANLAGREFGRGRPQPGLQQSGGVQHLLMDGAWLADQSFDDGAIVTQPVGSREPNVWGLFDMAGNAAEWTRSEAAAYPPLATEDGSELDTSGRKIVRGGSFFDRPARARSASRYSFPEWQRVFNVGFRVVCEDPQLATAEPGGASGAVDPVVLACREPYAAAPIAAGRVCARAKCQQCALCGRSPTARTGQVGDWCLRLITYSLPRARNSGWHFPWKVPGNRQPTSIPSKPQR